MSNNKHRAEASNAGLYDCPRCSRMNPEETRRLDICMTCKQGDKFVEKPKSYLDFKA